MLNFLPVIFKGVRRQSQLRSLLEDLIMVVLLAVNLTWIIFDWLFQYEAIRELLGQLLPVFATWYAGVVHPKFILIDLAFVAIFLIDFFIGWGLAIARHSYHRWFFYPFVHWYDLLGCVPIAGFRFLRLLRIVSIVYRLHRSGIIDLSDALPVRVVKKYYNVLVEEISDRVALKLLSDVQTEIRNGGPVVDKIVTNVIRPHKESLVEWMSHRVATVASENYGRYRGKIRSYVRERINHAFERSEEFGRLEQIPMLGRMARNAIENAISDVVFDVLNGMMQDLASDRNRFVLDESTEVVFDALLLKDEDSELQRIVVDTIDRSLEIVKQQVQIQQWKLRDSTSTEEDFQQRLREELNRMETPSARASAHAQGAPSSEQGAASTGRGTTSAGERAGSNDQGTGSNEQAANADTQQAASDEGDR